MQVNLLMELLTMQGLSLAGFPVPLFEKITAVLGSVNSGPISATVLLPPVVVSSVSTTPIYGGFWSW